MFCRAWYGSKLFDTDSIPGRFFFEKSNLKKKSTDDKKAHKITQHAKSWNNEKCPESSWSAKVSVDENSVRIEY